MGTLTQLNIRPIISEEERLQIYEEADKDGGRHPIMPSHVVRKDDNIVGAFCLTSPTVYWWMHTDKIIGRESLALFKACDTLMTQQGYDTYVLPCEPESPYFKLLSNKLDHFSGTDGGDWRLFLNKTGE